MSLKANHEAKPSRPKYTVEHMGKRGFVVLDPAGKPVTEGTAFVIAATRDCRDLQQAMDRKNKVGPRACLSCAREFESEGIHNRLCSGCRGRDAGADPVRPYIARRSA